VNEYGMTELFSQFYDAIMLDKGVAKGNAGPALPAHAHPRVKIGPRWTRTFVIDPATLGPVTEGEKGILKHLDLANAGSVMAVLTEDMGRASGDGFILNGRPAQAESRGCGLTFAEIAGDG
jgi:hypothetical protein